MVVNSEWHKMFVIKYLWMEIVIDNHKNFNNVPFYQSNDGSIFLSYHNNATKAIVTSLYQIDRQIIERKTTEHHELDQISLFDLNNSS